MTGRVALTNHYHVAAACIYSQGYINSVVAPSYLDGSLFTGDIRVACLECNCCCVC